ncbi:Mrp/NBP35 family ATP-binding protein [Alicyclobacillus herbarius]|uniref:Mrp/NBP35 family ATP-binding protein n=1 Tax=Alicyclobacillus herbarius TaxID=122960 RepID=UPI0004003CFA|nr:P-loop NTPase [Alicyclobacillus herbarius]
MATREEVLEALRDVQDPEVHRSIVELDMVNDLVVEGDHVSVEILLTIRGCPLHTTIERSVRERLLALSGVNDVDVRIGYMTDEQRARFAEKVRGVSAQQGTPAILAEDKGVEFIAIASGKGGVGKSTVTANLALALAREGLRVGLVDADIYGFSIPGIFGLEHQRPTMIDDLIIPIEAHGVKLISMHYFVPPGTPVVWRGPMLGKMLRNFFSMVHWDDLDVMLLDLPPGTGDIALDVHQLLPKSKEIVVTTPQADAAAVAVRAGLMAKRTNHEVLGVIENMAFFECPGCGERTYLFGRGGGDAVAGALGVPVLGRVPLRAMDDGRSPLFVEPSPPAEVYQALARQVYTKIQAEKDRIGQGGNGRARA